jgi:Uma2 family endonuclease
MIRAYEGVRCTAVLGRAEPRVAVQEDHRRPLVANEWLGKKIEPQLVVVSNVSVERLDIGAVQRQDVRRLLW